jgi:hypothetical protein
MQKQQWMDHSIKIPNQVVDEIVIQWTFVKLIEWVHEID